ncbi:MAG: hypothetical protein E7633_02745 [Ruminococcaceae bacterium]|nr:hypothetical protein [Oscillospiraceae bacterium]
MKQVNITEIKEKLRSEAIYALTHKPIITYSSDRVKVWHDAFLLTRDLPTQPQKYSKSLKYFLENISIPINENDILIGRMVEESFTEEEEKVFQQKYMSEPGCFGRPDFVTENGHCSLRWDILFAKGISGLKADAEGWLGHYKKNGNESQVDFLESAIGMYEAIIIYLKRSAQECRKFGKIEQAEILDKISFSAPDDFFSAMQLYWTVTFIICAYLASNPTLTLGRPDLFLYDFYKKDIEEKKLTKEEVSLIVADFYAKNNLIMGRGEHQISEIYENSTCTGWHRILAYDAPQYLILSGTDPETGKTVANELTEIFVDEIVPAYKNPVIEFRYSKGVGENYPKLWNNFVSKIADSASAMIYNDIGIIEAYIKDGFDFKTAASYEHYGCNWPTIPTTDTIGPSLQTNVTRVMYSIIHDYAEREDEFDRERFLSAVYDTFFDIYAKRAQVIKEISAKNLPNSKHIKLVACFSKNNIENAGLYYENINVLASIGTVCSAIDMAVAMEYMCKEKGYSPKKLMEICDRDFENDEYTLALCKNAPKAGQNDELADFYVERIPRLVLDAAERSLKDIPSHCHIRYCSESDTGHIAIGASLGATPDGRRKGESISQNNQPSHGSAKNGITAMLSSMNKMPLDRLFSGAMNVTIQPKNFAGEEGIAKLAKIMEVYFEKGGLQLQISAVDRDKLLAAQNDPDSYRDLMVRVTGYSAVFVDLSRRAQDDIIARDAL